MHCWLYFAAFTARRQKILKIEFSNHSLSHVQSPLPFRPSDCFISASNPLIQLFFNCGAPFPHSFLFLSPSSHSTSRCFTLWPFSFLHSIPHSACLSSRHYFSFILFPLLFILTATFSVSSLGVLHHHITTCPWLPTLFFWPFYHSTPSYFCSFSIILSILSHLLLHVHPTTLCTCLIIKFSFAIPLSSLPTASWFAPLLHHCVVLRILCSRPLSLASFTSPYCLVWLPATPHLLLHLSIVVNFLFFQPDLRLPPAATHLFSRPTIQFIQST